MENGILEAVDRATSFAGRASHGPRSSPGPRAPAATRTVYAQGRVTAGSHGVRVGISLLTLVPGISGGSETYARELVRALGRVGRARVPRLPADDRRRRGRAPGRGRRASTAAPARRSGVSPRCRAPSLARPRHPEALRRARRRPLPAQRDGPAASPPAGGDDVLDVQHEFLPQFFSRAERAYRRVVYGWSVRREPARDHDLASTPPQTLVERLGLAAERVRPIHLGVDHERFRPGDEPREPFLLYPARGWPHKNHARCSRRSRRSGASGPS